MKNHVISVFKRIHKCLRMLIIKATIYSYTYKGQIKRSIKRTNKKDPLDGQIMPSCILLLCYLFVYLCNCHLYYCTTVCCVML